MVSMAIMVASFRQSLDDWLVRVLPADVYVRAGAAGDSALSHADEQRALAALRGRRTLAFLRAQSVLLDPAQPRVTLLARDLPPGDPRQRAAAGRRRRTCLRAGDPPPVWVSESGGRPARLRTGARMQMPLGGQLRTFVVAGDLARLRAPAGRARASIARPTSR